MFLMVLQLTLGKTDMSMYIKMFGEVEPLPFLKLKRSDDGGLVLTCEQGDKVPAIAFTNWFEEIFIHEKVESSKARFAANTLVNRIAFDTRRGMANHLFVKGPEMFKELTAHHPLPTTIAVHLDDSLQHNEIRACFWQAMGNNPVLAIDGGAQVTSDGLYVNNIHAYFKKAFI